jgi:ribosomal protein S21
MTMARVRVEAKERGGHWEDRDKEFRALLGKFRKIVSETGIINTYKQHSEFESKSRRRRRKRKEAELTRLKAQLRDNFTQQYSKENNKDKKQYKEW